MPGMKEGIGDDPFDDEDCDATDSESPAAESSETAESTQERESRTPRSLPYIHSRDSVKDGRQQRPVFLREETEAGIGDLVDAVEADLGEDVYQTDVLEAAMEVAIDRPELVAEKCRSYGYDWE